MKKQRKHTRRGTYYRTLAKGYAALNAPIRADIFQGTVDYFDDNDPPQRAHDLRIGEKARCRRQG